MPCVSLFSRRNPDVNFEVHDGITYTLYRYLMDGIIDISIARTPLRLDDVDYKILSSEPMIAVSSKDMLPEKNGSLKLPDLLNIPLIIYRRYEALIMDAFHSRGMEPDLFCVCDDPRGAMLWAKEGLATAIFPQSMSSLPGTPHPAARRKRPGNADRRDLEKGAETLSASAGLCRCLHEEHIIIEEVRCAGLFFRDQRSGLPFLFLILLLHKQQRDIQQCHNHRNRKQGNFQPQTVRVFSHDFFRGRQINLRKYRNRELHSKKHL